MAELNTNVETDVTTESAQETQFSTQHTQQPDTTSTAEDTSDNNTPKSNSQEGRKAESKKVSLSEKLFGSGVKKVEVPSDYVIDFPEDFPADQVAATKEMFVEKGISKDVAQHITNSMITAARGYEEATAAKHEKQCEADIQKLKTEYGEKGFKNLNKQVKAFVKDHGLGGDDLDAFMASYGAYKSFKMLEKLHNRYREAPHSAPTRSESVGTANNVLTFDDLASDPKFVAKLTRGDKEATARWNKYVQHKYNTQ